jgi:type I restriction enzyme S subunit
MIQSNWIEVNLGSIADVILGGTPSTAIPEYWKPEIDWVTAKDISETTSSKIYQTGRLISKKGLEKSPAKILPPLTTVIIARGATMGKCRLLGRAMALNQTCYGIIAREKDADPIFLYYYLSNLYDYFRATAHGSIFDTVIGSGLRELKVNLPPLSEQQAIAGILGALDDKINLNRRIINTLDSIISALFKSWFVDFEPIYKGGKRLQPNSSNASISPFFPQTFVDSALGQIPYGWKISPLDEVCQRITDGSHNSPKSVKYGYPMASVKDMHQWGFNLGTCRHISESDYDELVKNDCRPLKDDVLIAKDGSYLKHIFVVEQDLNLVILSSIAILRSNEKINSHFLAYTLRGPNAFTRMENYVTGAVLQRIVIKDFRQFPILVPPQVIQTEWANLITPMIQKCWSNIRENNILSNLRDTLLPKLMRGVVRVKQIEKML